MGTERALGIVPHPDCYLTSLYLHGADHCVLINGIDMSKRKNGYYYSYGKYSKYGYGKKYGYGYGNEK